MALLAGVSCVYDFDPEIQQVDMKYPYVIEGDILIGDYTDVLLNRAFPFQSRLPDYNFPIPIGKPVTTTPRYLRDFLAWVDCDDGTSLTGTYQVDTRPFFRIDTRNLDPDRKYRLRVMTNTVIGPEGTPVPTGPQLTYVSEWMPVSRSSEIDSLSYEVVGKEKMSIRVSTGGKEPLEGRYIKWTGKETWRYTAQLYATHQYDITSNAIVPFKLGENNHYYCWSTASVPYAMSLHLDEYAGNKLVDREIYSYGPKEAKLSNIYSVEILQQNISEDAYRFWTVMNRNTYDVGGLFSPQPSQIRGNIVNVEDSSQLVIGYISVCQVSRARLFINNKTTRFYSGVRVLPDYVIVNDPERYMFYYRHGYGPYEIHQYPNPSQVSDSDWDWYPLDCLDCRRKGGVDVPPDFWPDNL